MTRDPSKAPAKLVAACQVFTELGWTQVRLEHGQRVDVQRILDLPLGTPAQQQIARDGLARGEWGSFGSIGDSAYGWVHWLAEDIDATVLAWFALRVGVDAKRVHRLGLGWQDDLVLALVEARGETFVRQYLAHCSPLANRIWEHSASGDAVVALSLVARHNLPIPEHLGYLKDWAIQADAVLGGRFHETELRFGRDRAKSELIESRFAEHARVAAGLGLAATGPFGDVLVAGVRRGWIGRDEAVDLAFAALDAAQRPGDRKVWAENLVGPFQVSDTELVARVDTLVAVLSSGEAPVIEAFAPRLIAAVPDESLLDVALVALGVTTKKVRKLVLTALAGRPVDAATADVLVPIVLDSAGDRVLAPAVRKVLAAWEVSPEAAVPDFEPATTRGLWQPQPQLWHAPAFDVGPISAHMLANQAAQLHARPESSVYDIAVERFLVLANAVARSNLQDVRSALKGAQNEWAPGLGVAQAWLADEPSPSMRHGEDSQRDALEAREAQVFDRLGEFPVLLSQPTWDDFRLDPADLVLRLETYAQQGVVASEADLLLAATRLDPALVRAHHRAVFARSAVPARGITKQTVIKHAGAAILAYLDDPIVEPGPETPEEGRTVRPTAGLNEFPNRFVEGWMAPGAAVFPLWHDLGDSAPGAWPDASQGVLMRHLAQSRLPLSPRLAGGFVKGLRNEHANAQADQHLAIVQAWQRGLLVPGVADVIGEGAEGLAATARICGDLAEQGMLAWVWPVLGDLVAASASAPRMLAGTAEVLEQMVALWPEVAAAVESGLADASAAALPGVRVLAQRKGNSRAVAVARALAAQLAELPPELLRAVSAQATASTTSVPFDARPWEVLLRREVCDDRAELRARWLATRGKSRQLGVEFTPVGSEESYVDAATWTYAMDGEGQFCAERVNVPGGEPSRVVRWFRFEPEDHTLLVGEHRNWVDGTDGPLARGDATIQPLSTTAAALLLGSLCHDQRSDWSARELLGERFHPETIRLAMSRLLSSNGDLAPGRMVRLLEEEVNLLAALWPVLTESVAHAASLATSGEKLPAWLNRILDVAILHADTLRTAGVAGLIPAEHANWSGLNKIADLRGKSAALTKARELKRLLTLS